MLLCLSGQSEIIIEVMSLELIWGTYFSQLLAQLPTLSHPETDYNVSLWPSPWARTAQVPPNKVKRRQEIRNNKMTPFLQPCPATWFVSWDSTIVTNPSSSSAALKCSRKSVQNSGGSVLAQHIFSLFREVLFHLGSSVVTGAGARKHIPVRFSHWLKSLQFSVSIAVLKWGPFSQWKGMQMLIRYYFTACFQLSLALLLLSWAS